VVGGWGGSAAEGCERREEGGGEGCTLHYEVNFAWSCYYFIQMNDVRVGKHPENRNFTHHLHQDYLNSNQTRQP
jgi:hypothetical protein